MLISLMVPYAKAAEEDLCILHISYMDEDMPIPDVSFRIYYVAGYALHGQYALAPAFEGCNAVLGTTMTNSQWVDAAQTLLIYAETNAIEPDATGITNIDGDLVFTDMLPGVYLVDGDSVDMGQTIYTPQVFCIVVPDRDTDGNFIYDVTVTPKYEVQAKPTPTPELTPEPTLEPIETPEPTDIPVSSPMPTATAEPVIPTDAPAPAETPTPTNMAAPEPVITPVFTLSPTPELYPAQQYPSSSSGPNTVVVQTDATPNTGDETDVTIWWVMLAACISIGVFVIIKRRHHAG